MVVAALFAHKHFFSYFAHFDRNSTNINFTDFDFIFFTSITRSFTSQERVPFLEVKTIKKTQTEKANANCLTQYFLSIEIVFRETKLYLGLSTWLLSVHFTMEVYLELCEIEL